MTYDDTALVSVLVMNYNNGDMIFDTLASILSQTYPRIEIVINDDGSKEFDAEGIDSWIRERSKENIEKVIINVNKENLGTVKSIENAVAMSKGSIITQIAADDAFYSPDVFDVFVKELERLGKDVMFLVGQAKMMDPTMTKEMYDFVGEADKKAIMESTPEELFERSSVRCFIPAVNFWRRELQEKLGTFSDSYRLIEDYSKTLRMSRMGIGIHYLDEYILKHRDGGISHGNKKGTSRTFGYYVEDFVNIHRKEILPYMDSFSSDTVQAVLRNYSVWLKKYESLSNPDQTSNDGLLTRAVKKVLLSSMDVLQRIYDAVSKR